MNETFVLSELQEKEIIYSIYEFFLWRRDQEKEKQSHNDNANNRKGITNNGNSEQQQILLRNNDNNNNNTPAYIKYQSVLDNLCKQFSKYESDFTNKKICEGFPSLIVKTLSIDLSNSTPLTVIHQQQQQPNKSNNDQTALIRSPPMLNNQQAAVTTREATIRNDKHKVNLKRQLDISQESPKAKKKSRVGIAASTDTRTIITKQSNTTSTVSDNTKNYKINYLNNSGKTTSSETTSGTKSKQSNTVSTVRDSAKNNSNNNSAVKVTGKVPTSSDNSNHLQPAGALMKEKPIITTNATMPVATIINPDNNIHVAASKSNIYIQDWFEEQYNELVHFKAINGHTRVPVKNTDLGRWVCKIRTKKHQMDRGQPCSNPLSDEQIKKLDSIGFIWNASSAPDTEKEKFEERFNDLVHFKAFNGHTRVPANKKGLGYWVSRMRAKKREIDQGKPCPNPLSQEQIDRLDSLGFEWKIVYPEKYVSFEQRLEALMKYKLVHGNCDIPRRYEDDPSLGEWVKGMRKKYSKKMLTAERIKKLENIGFRWRVRSEAKRKTFDDRMEELIKFKEREGHFDVSTSDNLYPWVNKMRKMYSEKSLTEDCIKKLNDIGFNWVVATKTKTFDDRVEQCRNYRQRHGHLKIPRPELLSSQTEEDSSFFRWAYYLRKDYKRWKAGKKCRTMNESRFNILNEIGFDWTYDDVAERKREEEMLKKAKKDAPFYERLQELKELKEKVGSCNALKDFVKGGYNMQSPLYKWVKLQRTYWKEAKLSEEKVKKLEELDFDFNPRRNIAHFDDHLQQLKELKEKVGSINTLQDFVKGGYTSKSRLYQWTLQQRKRRERSKLSKERIKKLEELDFDFKIWKSRLRRCRGRKKTTKEQRANESIKQPSPKDEHDGVCEEVSTGDNDDETDSEKDVSSDDEMDSDGEAGSDNEEVDSDEEAGSNDEETDSDEEAASDERRCSNTEATYWKACLSYLD